MLGIILRPFCLVTEICPFGDLFTLIHNAEKAISWQLRIKIARDIAEGIKYLQGFFFFHFFFLQKPPPFPEVLPFLRSHSAYRTHRLEESKRYETGCFAIL